MNLMYLSSLVEGSLNICYDSLDGVSAVSRPVAIQYSTETEKLYKDIHVHHTFWERDRSVRAVEEITYEYFIIFSVSVSMRVLE